MNTDGRNSDDSAPADGADREWARRKKTHLSGLAANRATLKADKASLAAEKAVLLNEIEQLENENHILTKRSKSLEIDLTDNHRTSQRLIKEADERKKRLDRLLGTERGLLNEIEFLMQEKDRLSDQHRRVSVQLEKDLIQLDSAVSDMNFIKGEIETLLDKLGFLEREVPGNIETVDYIDDLFGGAIKVLKQLYARMQKIEKNTKSNYYKNKQGSRGDRYVYVTRFENNV